MIKWERQLQSKLLGKRNIFSKSTMRAALSSSSCFSCLKRSQEEASVDPNGVALPLQPQEHHTNIENLNGMSEGDVTVLPFAPATLDMSRQEPRTLTRLYCQNGGYHLRISSEGEVSGGRQENDPYDIMRIKAASVGVVVIKGENTARYLAMNKAGHLYGSQILNDECFFLEKYEENNYNTYRSQRYNWYVGLKKNGQPKPGPDTHIGQKAVCFLPRSV